jgi:hypothetical protein
MHSKSTTASADLAAYFRDGYLPVGNGHAHSIAQLVLERLPSGDMAWLKPCTEPAEDDEPLYVITEKGRRDLRMAELFGCDR